MSSQVEYDSIDALLNAAIDSSADLSDVVSNYQTRAPESLPKTTPGSLTTELVGLAYGGLAAQLKNAKT